MLASGPLYSSGTFWAATGAIAAFAALAVSVILWRVGAPRRVLRLTVPVVASLRSSHWARSPGKLEISMDDETVHNPYVVTMNLRNRSRRQIRSDDFDQGRPLLIRFGKPLIAVSADGSARTALDSITYGYSEVSIGPVLIGGGEDIELTLLTDGYPEIDWQNPIVGVRIKDRIKVSDPFFIFAPVIIPILSGAAFAAAVAEHFGVRIRADGTDSWLFGALGVVLVIGSVIVSFVSVRRFGGELP